jgi:hypothetical protein
LLLLPHTTGASVPSQRQAHPRGQSGQGRH